MVHKPAISTELADTGPRLSGETQRWVPGSLWSLHVYRTINASPRVMSISVERHLIQYVLSVREH